MLFLDVVIILLDIIKFIYQIKINKKNGNRASNTVVYIFIIN